MMTHDLDHTTLDRVTEYGYTVDSTGHTDITVSAILRSAPFRVPSLDQQRRLVHTPETTA